MIKKAINYGIDAAMMESLNYTDFLALIVEMDIDAVTDALKAKQQQIGAQRGYNIVEATNEDILRMHGM